MNERFEEEKQIPFESLTPMQRMIREMEAERAVRASQKYNPKDIAIAVLGGALFVITIVNAAEAIQNFTK